MSTAETPRSIHTLASGLIDYAGLFPPAKLGMAEVVRNYAAYLESGDAWMLGRLILPVSRLLEFETAAEEVLPRAPDAQAWPVSAVLDGELEAQLDAVWAFNGAHEKAGAGRAVIDAVEVKVPDLERGAAFIDLALDIMPEQIFPFFEIPAGAGDIRGCVAALAGSDAGAKIRTGGVTPGAFPTPEAIGEFLLACHAADVPFKATAGLHHAVRSERALTYEPGSVRGTMHGFLNVFLAAAFVRTLSAPVEGAAAVLREDDARAFVFSPTGVRWRDHGVELLQLAHTRETFALSFGSCSFTEPTGELRELGLL